MPTNLASIEDINRIVHQLNEGNYDIAPQQFYDRVLLDTIKLGMDNYVHLKNTQSYSLPKGTKKLQKRRWGGLTAHTTPLNEGIPPLPDKTSMESITFTATQFGRYMEFSDRVDLDQIDPQIAHYTKELGDVMARTLERYARETLLSAASKMFAENRTSVGGLFISDRITMEDLRFAVLRMQRLLVRPLSSGYFNYICSPEELFDMVDDETVKNYMELNNTTRKLYEDGQPFPLFQIKFIPTMLDEFYTPELDNPGEYYDGADIYLRIYAIDDEGNQYYYNLKDDGEGDSGPRRELANQYLEDGTAIESLVQWTIPEFSTETLTKIAAGASPADATEVTVGSGITVADANAMNWSQLPVHRGILYGKDALVKISIAGEDGVKTYVQGLGSAGVNDPIHQRQTIGAKINSIGYGLLRDEAVTVTYSVPSNAIYTSGLTAEVKSVENTVANKTADTEGNTLDYRDYTVTDSEMTDGTNIDKKTTEVGGAVDGTSPE